MASPRLYRGSCIGYGWFFAAMAKRPASSPIAATADAGPSASRSPRPSRRAIRFTISTTASPLPKRSSRPPVSSVVRSPSSKHSMAKAIITPVLIESREWALHSSVALETATMSSTPQQEPRAATDSYSGPP